MRTRLTHVIVAMILLGGLVMAAPAAYANDLSPSEGFQPLVTLRQGDSGATIERLQRDLNRLGMYHGAVNGKFDIQTAYAVRTFHAYVGLPPRYEFAPSDWDLLASPPEDPGIPHRWSEPDRVEVDIGRQLLFVVRDDRIDGILPISSGGLYWYDSPLFGRRTLAKTPHGDFKLYWHQTGWSCLPTCVYKYWGFTPYYGIHGYPDVPNYPRSHGCVRITLWDSRWVEPHLFVGIPIHVWDTRPTVPESPFAIVS